MSIYPNNPFRPINILSEGRIILFRGAKKVLPSKGNLAYEYNPLRNYRLEYDLFQYDELGRLGITDNLGKFFQAIIQIYELLPGGNFEYIKELTINNIYIIISTNEIYNKLIEANNGVILPLFEDWNFYMYSSEWGNLKKHPDEITAQLQKYTQIQNPDDPTKYIDTLIVTNRAGSLLDFDTDLLNFSLKNPVNIQILSSYDGSVNLILNDDKNYPKLINSRFSTMENDTYQITNHTGNNGTNIYDRATFDLETNLYKLTSTIATINFGGLNTGGNLKVGNYNFYFKLADIDGNETDFIGESRQVICHIGNLRDPFTIRGGLRDENSGKSAIFHLLNLDRAYDYISVYFTRKTSDELGNPVIYAGKVDRNYLIKNGLGEVIITGFEKIEDKTIDDINQKFEVLDAAKSAAQSLSMLFLGNVDKPEVPYKELSDLSLRILPSPYMGDNIGAINYNYQDTSEKYEYYNIENIYNYTSYWDKELYRFGIVFILNNYTISPVFNIRGVVNMPIINHPDELKNYYTDPEAPLYTNDTRNYILTENNLLKGGKLLENDKGVIRFDSGRSIIDGNLVTPIGVKFFIPKEVLIELRKHCRGFMFVRQERIPTILAQAIMIGLDRCSCTPTIPTLDGFLSERFISDSRILADDFELRSFYLSRDSIKSVAALCPEAELRAPLFTLIFTGEELSVSLSQHQPISEYFEPGSLYGSRHLVVSGYTDKSNLSPLYSDCRVTLIEDDILMKSSSTLKYSSRAGAAEEAWRVKYLNIELTNNAEAINIIRGSFGPYIGVEGLFKSGELINIFIPGYSESAIPNYFQIRYDDASPFFPISDRINILQNTWIDNSEKFVSHLSYNGDCFAALFTHRMNRNFQDPETPINDDIIDTYTWKNNYTPDNLEKNSEINRGDVNAVQLGHWVTFKVLSNINLCMRDVNSQYYTEIGLTGIPRGFFPIQAFSTSGNYKIPESGLISGGVSSSVSEKYNFIVPDVPWIRNQFDNRIMYSDIHITDAFKNGYRIFRSQNYRDYTKEYGAITKIIGWRLNLVCVCEHGILLIPVNERVLAGLGAGGATYINTANVLPENPNVISNTFGSTWIESIIETDDFIYGVDTVGKKVWRTNGQSFEIISNFKIQKFLNDNITLTEREKTPLIGVRNVKSHYNPFKKDVMFTFYDNLHGEEEKVWNICYNEILNKWITFYSWVPSYSESVNNIYYSFDRDTSKFITKLGISNSESVDADGICLDKVVFTQQDLEDGVWVLEYSDQDPVLHKGVIGKLDLKNRTIEDIPGLLKVFYDYDLEEDPYGNFLIFELIKTREIFQGEEYITGAYLKFKDDIFGIDLENYYKELYELLTYYEYGSSEIEKHDNKHGKKVYYLYFKANINYANLGVDPDLVEQIVDQYTRYTMVHAGYFSNVVGITPYSNIDSQIRNKLVNDEYRFYPGLTTDFWKHGQAGIIDIADEIKPTKWYGKVHPFEFEFIVTENPAQLKIFNNLLIVSNKAEPESFHFEVVGEGYEFKQDKKNMYYRQELTKEMFLLEMYKDIIYDRTYTKLPKPILNTKSSILPLYYDRVSTYDEIYDSYQRMTSTGKDYQNLTGGEIVWDKLMNEFKVLSHLKGLDIAKVGRLRGNMQYKEDIWNIEIRPINFMLKNESGDMPIVVSRIPNFNLVGFSNPNDYNQWVLEHPTIPISSIKLPETYTNNRGTYDVKLLDMNSWSKRKETRLRDKYIRIKVRYSGLDLAVIAALKTLYTTSFS